MDDNAFEAAIDSVTRRNELVDHVVRFGAETYYETHDWTKDPRGTTLEDKISAAGRSDLLPWIRDRRAAAEKIAEKYERAEQDRDRAQGVGDENAFYGRRQIDALPVGKNTSDPPGVNYSLPGSMGGRRNVYQPDPAHRRMLNAAFHDIAEAGFPQRAAMQAVRGVVIYSGNYSNWHAIWLPDHRVVGINEVSIPFRSGLHAD